MNVGFLYPPCLLMLIEVREVVILTKNFLIKRSAETHWMDTIFFKDIFTQEFPFCLSNASLQRHRVMNISTPQPIPAHFTKLSLKSAGSICYFNQNFRESPTVKVNNLTYFLFYFLSCHSDPSLIVHKVPHGGSSELLANCCPSRM